MSQFKHFILMLCFASAVIYFGKMLLFSDGTSLLFLAHTQKHGDIESRNKSQTQNTADHQ